MTYFSYQLNRTRAATKLLNMSFKYILYENKKKPWKSEHVTLHTQTI